MKTMSLFFLFLAIEGMACDCTGGSLLHSTQNSELVVFVEIEGQEDSSVKANIKELIKGIEARKQIRVQGDRGADCLSSTKEMKPGTRWIMALEKDKSSLSDYQISSCGHHYGKVEQDLVIGYLTRPYRESKKTEKLPIDEVRRRIRATP